MQKMVEVLSRHKLLDDRLDFYEVVDGEQGRWLGALILTQEGRIREVGDVPAGPGRTWEKMLRSKD